MGGASPFRLCFSRGYWVAQSRVAVRECVDPVLQVHSSLSDPCRLIKGKKLGMSVGIGDHLQSLAVTKMPSFFLQSKT